MGNERFHRFNPGEDNLDEYVYQASDHKDLRAVSILTGIVNPLVEEFAERIADIRPENVQKGELYGIAILPYQRLRDDSHTQPFKNLHLRRVKKQAIMHHRPGDIVRPLIAPVGDYGERLARALVASGISLSVLLQEHLEPSCRLVDEQYGSFLAQETFWKGALPVMMEAVQTTVASLAVLSPERVQGFERDPLALCHEIAEQQVLDGLAGRIPFGETFPIARMGFVFPTPLVNNDGKLSLSPVLVSDIQEEREKSPNWPRPGNRKKGCPAAARTIPLDDTLISGVTLMAQSLQPFLKYEYTKLVS